MIQPETMAIQAGRAVIRDAASQRWLHFAEPREIVETHAAGEVLHTLRRVEKAVETRGLCAAGFIAYEAAPAFDPALPAKPDGQFPLVWFGLYDAPTPLELPPVAPEPEPLNLAWRASATPAEYRLAFEKIKDYIRQGDTYQVNYSYRLWSSIAGDAWPLFRQLLAAQNPAYGACISTGEWVICSASPELFFRLDGQQIESRPMKGTAARGLTYARDLEQAKALRASEKDRAENVMIVDMVRNDLGRVAETGSVIVSRLFDIEKFPTLWQMTSTVRAKTRASLVDIFKAAFPPASITGAPKARTMRIIAELETTPRRVYTGCIGFWLPGRRAQFNVAIRTLLLHPASGRAEYGVGGGIVWDSDLNLEQMECRTKARILEGPAVSFCLLETMLWTPEQGYHLLKLHLRRLAESADYFGFAFDPAQVNRELEQRARAGPRLAQRVRLLLAQNGQVTIQAGVHPPAPIQPPPRVRLARSPVDSSNPFLYHKTTHRQVYEHALAGCAGYEDVLLYNERGEITESTIGNVAADLDGVLYTPPIHCGLLAGTCRAWMLEQGLLRERPITVEQLRRSPRVCVMNSIRGMYAVKFVEENA